MFVVEALFDFSAATLQPAAAQSQEDKDPAVKQGKQEGKQPEEEALDKGKRKRSEDHDRQLQKEGGDKYYQGKKEKTQQFHYLTFQKGDKILVQQSFQTGWWFGNLIKKPAQTGFFPSNYVKVGAKPPPPPKPSKQSESEDEQEEVVFDPGEGGEWMAEKLNEAEGGDKRPLTSDYYQGITGFKYVKINENNKGILNGNYVKFDVNTGLARVPVKDQAPTAKAVRQMGYYFDYHQWNQQKNKNPEAFKNKPDPNKKRKKRLHLVGMGKDA